MSLARRLFPVLAAAAAGVALGAPGALAATDRYAGCRPLPPSRPSFPPAPAGVLADCFSTCASLTWESLAPVISVLGSGEGVEGAAAGVMGGRIYVSHGYSFGDNAKLRIYDILSDSWSLGPDAMVLRSEGSGAVVSGKLYSIGGRVLLDAVEVFDPATATWTSMAPMPTPRKGMGVGVIQGRIHVVGGSDGSGPATGIPFATHEVLDPATGLWSTAAPMPIALGDVYSTVAIADRLYVFGGWDGFSDVPFTQIYDQPSDSSIAGAPMPTPRSAAVAGVLDGRAVVIGGIEFGFNNLSLVEVYDPAADRWCAGPSKPTPASEFGVGEVATSDSIYAIGSGATGLSGNVHERLVLRQGAADAVAGAGSSICAGATATLDGSASPSCPAGLLYRWLDGATPVCDWSPAPTCAASPAGTTTYTLEVACSDAPACVASDAATVTVVPFPVAALVSADAVCAGDPVTLDATGSGAGGCLVPLEYQFLDGATVIQPWGPAPTYGPVAPGASTTYTVEVRCTATPGCVTRASRDVEVVPYPVPALAALADVCAGDTVTLDASGSSPAACPVALEYQFLEGVTVLQPWGPAATHGPVTPGASTTYSVEVRCTAAPGCLATTSRAVAVVPYPVAALAALPDVCAGDSITLDASASSPASCPVPLEFQFRQGATVLRGFGPGATFGPLAPPGSVTYSVDVRCPAGPGCARSTDRPATVVPDPVARAGADVSPCQGDRVTLDGSTSTSSGCPGGALYEWRQGATVMRPASPVPTWSPPTATPGVTTYTLIVSCASSPGCSGGDDVTVTVRSCPMAVDFDQLQATRAGASAAVEIRWTTLREEGTNLFVIERADEPGGSFVPVGGPIPARGAGHLYAASDPSAERGTRPWYRIVEHTSSGRGDISPSFETRSEDASGGRSRRRSRRSGS